MNTKSQKYREFFRDLLIHFVPLHLCPFATTFVEKSLQIRLFMQNKPNFPHFSLKNDDFAKKQTQFKPNQSQFWPKNEGGKAKQTQFKAN